MESNYKRLGKYIREVNVRDTDKKVTLLLGVSIEKIFKPSIANTIGTDMSTYKIVKRNQFAYGPVTSRNGDKISIALLEDYVEAIVSQAYTPFEIIDTNELLSEYLMMWFRRPEFDRYARFMSHGSAREIFGWEEMCDTEMPVPHPDKQREIVKEYNTIVNRIKLNQQLIQKLEETAQALYKEWFVDFEFPDENGKPYKSSGREMVFNEELEMDIPKGWFLNEIGIFSKEVITGKTPSTDDSENFGDFIPFVTIPDMHKKVFTLGSERSLSEKGANIQKNKTLPINSICVSCIGTAGLVVLTSEPCQTNQQINSVICKDHISPFYTFFLMREVGEKIKGWGNTGSVAANVNKKDFSSIRILIAREREVNEFHKLISPLFDAIKNHQKQKLLLIETIRLINAKIST